MSFIHYEIYESSPGLGYNLIGINAKEMKMDGISALDLGRVYGHMSLSNIPNLTSLLEIITFSALHYAPRITSSRLSVCTDMQRADLEIILSIIFGLKPWKNMALVK